MSNAGKPDFAMHGSTMHGSTMHRSAMHRSAMHGSVMRGSAMRGSVILAGVVLLLFLGKVLLIPLAFALTLSFLLAPAVAWLEKLRLPRAMAVAVVSALMGALLLLGAYVLSRQVLHVAQTLPVYRENMKQRIAALHASAEGSIEMAIATVEDISADLALGSTPSESRVTPVRLVDPRRGQLQAVAELIGQILRPVGETGVVVIFAIYMLMKREELRHRLLLLAGMGHINLMTRALNDATERISRYLVMQFEVNACYGILFGTGLWVLHVPDATLWGMTAGVLRIVPYVGTTAGMVLPLVVSIAMSSNWWPPMLVVALFLVLELIAAYFVEPWLFSSRTGISSLALLGSAIFWTMLWGWPGLVLSTPLTVCVVVLGRYVPQMSFLNSLLGTNAELSPAAHFYERLLAMDQAAARAIAEKYLDGKPLVQLYDAVIIPALGLAEEDRHKGTLDEVQSNFMVLCVGELVARLTNYHQRGLPMDETSEWSVRQGAARALPRKDFAVICISAADKADELTTVMLTQLLERASYPTLILPADAVAEEILKGLAAEKNTVIFISALPPFAFAEVRAICQRVRMHLVENRVIVGLWSSSDNQDDDTLEPFGSARPDVVVSTLTHAIRQLEQWHQDGKQAEKSSRQGAAD